MANILFVHKMVALIRERLKFFRKPESACLGAAILAAIGSKVFKNLKEATEKTVTIKERVLSQSGKL